MRFEGEIYQYLMVFALSFAPPRDATPRHSLYTLDLHVVCLGALGALGVQIVASFGGRVPLRSDTSCG
jgi:hypothetical protein